MRKVLLSVSLIALTSVALAGGGGSRPAVQTSLPRTAVVQPGHTWVMTGTTAAGEQVQAEFRLSAQAPERDGTSWDFDAENGPFTYDPVDGTLFVANLLPALTDGAPAQVCVAMFEGPVAQGALLSGSMEEIDAQMKQLPADAPDPKNGADAVRILRSYGIPAGTCTLKRKL